MADRLIFINNRQTFQVQKNCERPIFSLDKGVLRIYGMFADVGVRINVGDLACRCQGTKNPKGGDARAQANQKVKVEKEGMDLTGMKGARQGNFLLSHDARSLNLNKE